MRATPARNEPLGGPSPGLLALAPHGPARRSPKAVPGSASLRPVLLGSVVAALIFVAAAGVVSFFLGTREVIGELEKFGPLSLAGFAGLWFVAFATRLWRWHCLSRSLGLDVPALRLALYYAAGLAFTTTPGRVGEAARLWFLNRGHGVPLRISGPILVADRLSDLCCVLVMCLVGIGAFLEMGAVLIPAMLLGAGVVVLGARPALLIPFVNIAHVMLARRQRRLFAGLRRALRLLGRIFSGRAFLLTLLPALAGWMIEAVLLLSILSTLGGPAPVGFVALLFIVGFAMLAGSAPFLPGGLGGVEVAMTGLLVFAHVASEQALAATLVFRSTTFWLAITLGLVTLGVVLRLLRADRPRSGRQAH